MHFSTDQIEFFRSNGYVAGPRVLSDEQLDRLRAQCDGILDGRIDYPDELRGVANAKVKGNLQFRKITNLFRHDPVFAEVISNSAISSLAHDLMEGPVRVWEDQSIAKAPGDEFGVVAWHQDYTYWDHVGPSELATCWIALDDATVANACMHVIPGSHKSFFQHPQQTEGVGITHRPGEEIEGTEEVHLRAGMRRCLTTC